MLRDFVSMNIKLSIACFFIYYYNTVIKQIVYVSDLLKSEYFNYDEMNYLLFTFHVIKV